MVKCFSFYFRRTMSGIVAIQKKGEEKDCNVIREYICKYKKFPCSLFVKKVKTTREGLVFVDDLSDVKNEWENAFSYNMFSEALKNCLDEVRTKCDDYEWIPVEIIGSTETRIYYTAFFNSLPDVLDEKNTTYLKHGGVLRPCYAVEKICKYSIFPSFVGHHPNHPFWQNPHTVYFNEIVKKHIKKKFTDLYFTGVLCSKNGVC